MTWEESMEIWGKKSMKMDLSGGSGEPPSRMRADHVLKVMSEKLDEKAASMLLLARIVNDAVERGEVSLEEESRLWHLFNQMW